MAPPADAFDANPAPTVVLLHREQTEAMVRATGTNGGRIWDEEAVKAAWELTHGHPYLLQQLSWAVWERKRAKGEAGDDTARPKRCAACEQMNPADSPVCRACGATTWQVVERKRPTATRDDVEAAVPAALQAAQRTLQRLWDGVQPSVRAVAWVMAKEGPQAMPEERLQQLLRWRGLHEAVRDPARATASIEGWDLLEAADGGYRFRLDLVRRWILTLDPPEGALELAEAARARTPAGAGVTPTR